jgi:hypothetical protein
VSEDAEMPNRETSELGAVILDCKQLPPVVQTMGFGNRNAGGFAYARTWVLCYVFMPLVPLPLFGLWVATPLAMGSEQVTTWFLGGPRRPVVVSTAITSFAAAYLWLAWFAYLWPRTRYLRVHEFGISGKWPWPWRGFSVRV